MADEQPTQPVRPKSKQFDAFLSHNSLDKQDVEKIREKLESAGFKIWIDRNELSGGDSLPTTLKRALKNSASCIVFIGAHGVGPWQEKEIAATDKLRRPKHRMIPVFLPGSTRILPASLEKKDLLWIDFRDFNDQPALDRLCKDIRTKVKEQSRWDRARRALILAGVVIPLAVLAWTTKEFCTFQAVFEPPITNQRQEIVIIRRFDPRPPSWRFRQGTWIFEDDCVDVDAKKKVFNHLELNCGLRPNWSSLEQLLDKSRRSYAELELLNRRISVHSAIIRNSECKIWERVEPGQVISALFEKIEDETSDRYDRFDAAEKLVQLGKGESDVVKKTLVRLVRSNEQTIRSGVADLLARIGTVDMSTLDALNELLRDSNDYVRIDAAESLVKLGQSTPQLKATLIRFLDFPNGIGLQDPPSDIPARAVAALARIAVNDVSLIDELIQIVQRRVAFVERRTTAAYSNCGAAEVLVRIGRCDTNVLGTLVELLEHNEIEVRWRAATALGEIGRGDNNIVAGLISLQNDDSSLIRRCVAESIAKLGTSNPEIIEALLTLQSDPDGIVQENAVRSLTQLGKSDANVVTKFISLVQNSNGIIRSRAAMSLVQLGKCGIPVSSRVRKLLNSERDTRLNAAWILVQLRMADNDVVTVLRNLLESGDAGNVAETEALVRAAGLLVEMGQNDELVLKTLSACLETYWSNETCLLAATSLVRLEKSDENLVATLAKLIQINGFTSNNIQSRAASLLVQLSKALVQKGQSDSEVVQALVKSVTLSGFNNSDVRARAVEALGQLGTSYPNVVEVLIASLKDENRDVRVRAAVSLEQIKANAPRVLEALVALLKDRDHGVREAAATAIGKLAQGCPKLCDNKRVIAELASNDSSIRERAGIILAYREQKVDSKLTQDETHYLQEIRDHVGKSAHPWVKQAALHAIYRIEKRRAELEEASPTTKREPQ